MRAGIVLRAVAVVGAAGLLASCGYAPSTNTASKEYFSPATYGAASPKVVADARRPVPKGGGYRMVGKPYQVAGKTYIPRDNPRYSATGLASWYGAAFHGRQTANGEVYDVNALTAAHPTMPLPSYARVTNLENGRSVIVRVNDRGPFARDRVIDVSRTAADMLDFRQNGTAKVQVDYVGPARMDGLDRNMLVASYRGPEIQPPPNRGFTLFASAAKPRPQGTFQVASAPMAAPRAAPTGVVTQPVSAYASTASGDNLGALILRSGLSQSYAEPPRKNAAQQAATNLAAHDLTTELTQAAQRKARAISGGRDGHGHSDRCFRRCGERTADRVGLRPVRTHHHCGRQQQWPLGADRHCHACRKHFVRRGARPGRSHGPARRVRSVTLASPFSHLSACAIDLRG